MSKFKIAVMVCVGISGCSDPPMPATDVTSTAVDVERIVTLRERYVTAADEAMNIDSVATYPGSAGVTWLFATAKTGNVVRIYDAANGELVRDLGGRGDGAGQFRRPNGVVTLDGMLVIVERDNRRVQIFSLPALEPLAIFGQDLFEKPYGAYLQPLGGDRYRLFVTDAYETADEQVPPENELDRRVRVWTLDVTRDALGTPSAVAAEYERSFGETSGPGVLRVVESIWGDPAHDRLLVAEEDPAGGRVLKGYTFAGRFNGEIVGDGIFQVQPEGIALYECADGGGYWLTTDQGHGRNVFHVFDRQSLAHVGAFQGEVTRNTDGIWLTQQPSPGFPAGAFFAVHDDQAVAAFDWRAIAGALSLRAECART